MGFMYGGQIMKKKYPNSATTYEFTDIVNKRLYIRENICQDTQDFIDEANEGYRWHIKISEELEKLFNGNVG
jgi:disulfide oxidoreductase YuzD